MKVSELLEKLKSVDPNLEVNMKVYVEMDQAEFLKKEFIVRAEDTFEALKQGGAITIMGNAYLR
jgi:hypothetical protein